MSSPDWVPRGVVTDEVIDPGPVAALTAIFDDGLPVPRPGDLLPPLWHWVALPRWSTSSVLDIDGHPFRGSFLPPIELPRRMIAGGTVEFHAPLVVGATTRRESTVESVTEKSGRSGALVVVVVATTLHTPDGRPAVVERQNLIYREPPTAAPQQPNPGDATHLKPVGPPLAAHQDGGWDFRTDPTLLMRFSAATANAHRIHYDWPYATGVEGYPGLVVHGPLMTLALMETQRLSGDLDAVSGVSHRNHAPLFCGQPARAHASDTGSGRSVTLLGPGGTEAAPRSTIDLTFSESATTSGA
ncbi:FAS1-like dehydratase domain-containing protein [Gordonia zhaorongruii]|uniref:FAS1-like dehydratase domain-containing protein n=1 Tax=Gordonia zhaorongruii TaxID=2597659 RepID=UPI0011801D21|nr:MaoC family dehydratase N-terminal domain-containing protein [Gordonia zhaorongruii]